MLLIRVCQWIKLRIQLVTKVPVKVIRAGFRKSDKPSSIIPGMFKGQPFSCPLSLSEVRTVHLRNRIRHFVIWWSIGESNPCSATDIGATAHWAARFLSVEAGTDDISATGSHQCQPLSNASHSLRQVDADTPCPHKQIRTPVKGVRIVCGA